MSTDDGSTETTDPAPVAAATKPARTMAALVLDAAARFSGTALKYPAGDRWLEISYPKLGTGAREIAKGLIALGVQPGDRVAILSNTRAEWTLADFGAICAGATVVPVYQTNSPEECLYVLDHSGSTVIFCEDSQQLEKIDEIRGELPGLGQVIRFEGESESAMTLAELKELGAEISDEQLDERIAAIGDDDVFTIVYTSGTTGPPKGCMLTHENLRAAVDGAGARIDFDLGEEIIYVFLPLAHVLTRLVQMAAIDVGAQLAYWHRDPKKIVADVGEIAPTTLPSVPRVFEKIYTAATSRVEAAGGPKAKLFWWAVGVGRQVREREAQGGHNGLLLDAQFRLADKLVLHKVRALFGGRIKLALTGAAPIDVDILSFFHACGVWVLEGYGMSETSSLSSINTISEHKLGTVGRPVPGCEVKIADDGEILMSGPVVFKGYYRDEDATKETMPDRWLHSGDLGELDADGYVSITGRKKDLIITSSGKNISPSNIENSLKLSRWVSQAVVFGDRKPYLTALVTLDPDEAKALAEKVGADDASPAALAKHPGVRDEIQLCVDDTNRRFARIEQVKRWEILERDLSQEEGELTPSLKVKRNVVYERYADEFAELYDRS
ncbi:MAG: long-chain fatty acid--CoA ligase [Solirubrobacterales bacterium]|nr:long-chain fatty acid--CoA ligase [Solirubrobacterales bacterium]